MIEPKEIQILATEIYSQYVIPFMSDDLKDSVSKNVNPAFDDLFDDVEEYREVALKCQRF